MLPGDLATMCATQKRLALALVLIFPLGAAFIFELAPTDLLMQQTRISLSCPRLGLRELWLHPSLHFSTQSAALTPEFLKQWRLLHLDQVKPACELY